MTLAQIENDLKEGTLGGNPTLCATYRGWLAATYSFEAGILEEIMRRKALIWNEIRKNTKSDKSADRQYEATQDGIDEQVIRLRMKRLEKLLSSLKTLIEIAEGQARSMY